MVHWAFPVRTTVVWTCFVWRRHYPRTPESFELPLKLGRTSFLCVLAVLTVVRRRTPDWCVVSDVPCGHRLQHGCCFL